MQPYRQPRLSKQYPYGTGNWQNAVIVLNTDDNCGVPIDIISWNRTRSDENLSGKVT